MDRVLAVFGSCPDGVWDFSLLRLPLVFCCSRLSGLCFAVRGFRKRCSKARFREAQKIVFVNSKGNVKEFFGSGFGRFRLVSRWCLGLFASTATACVLLFEAFGSGVLRPDFATVLQRVLLLEAFGLVFCCSRLSEAVFQGQISRGPKDCFCGFQRYRERVFWLGFWPFSARVQMVFRTFRI